MPIDLATLKDIRQRLRSATGADTELDARLMCLFAAPKGSTVDRSKIDGSWKIYASAAAGERPAVWDNRVWPRPEGWAVTASLEAALDFAERIYNTGSRAHWVTGRHAWPIPEAVRHYAMFPWGTGTGFTAALAVLNAVVQAKVAVAENGERRLAS